MNARNKKEKTFSESMVTFKITILIEVIFPLVADFTIPNMKKMLFPCSKCQLQLL